MKRRRFIQTLAVTPALAVPVAANDAAPSETQQESAGLEISVADTAAETRQKFFTALQFSALKRLSDIIMPSMNGLPGAIDAGAPDFLDFLIGASPADRQRIYRTGLDQLNAQARRKFGKHYADITDDQAVELLAPLRKAWTYNPPSDPLERFLREAKADIRTATVNSREYVTADSSGGRRRGGVGQYWYPID